MSNATPSELTPAVSADSERIARFRRVAIPVISVILVVCVAGSFARPIYFPEREGPDFNKIIGESYANVYLYFGAPPTEDDDGQGGRVLHYDEFQVIGDHFELRQFHIYVSADGRVYKFERD